MSDTTQDLKILLIEDNPGDAFLIREMLAAQNGRSLATAFFGLVVARQLSEGLEAIQDIAFDAILLDLNLPDSMQFDTFTAVHTHAPNIPIIILTGFNDEQLAREAVIRGAQDYIPKDNLDPQILSRAIRHAVERQELIRSLTEAARELEQKNQSLDKFAQTMAHQARNLLSQMLGYTSIYLDHHAQDSNNQDLSLLKKAITSGKKMNNVFSELLLLAGVRQDAVKQQRFNMAWTVKEALKRLEFIIDDRGGNIQMPDSWPDVIGHDVWIEEVWVNYISNGLKYGGQPPKLQLGCDYAQDCMIRFWVKDNGAGIKPDEQARLFQAHSRLEQIKVRGEGLGLSIVKQIVEKCDGAVGVISRPGEGSLFWFTLPAPQDFLPTNKTSTLEANLYREII
ncbi:MAG: hybrid sensor histidine kinase/response regulator [Ardenticatenaceae bacterium]|nr:hybrid sensor histidine kinase/response regulator [Ardenticatenaceae bacterium]MCB9442787.1 hybrid sensor histidine kinase/response regulator [Ardenticatenaceae bacterium]